MATSKTVQIIYVHVVQVYYWQSDGSNELLSALKELSYGDEILEDSDTENLNIDCISYVMGRTVELQQV